MLWRGEVGLGPDWCGRSRARVESTLRGSRVLSYFRPSGSGSPSPLTECVPSVHPVSRVTYGSEVCSRDSYLE